MSKLEKGLKEWVALGLISSDQAARIRHHEAAKPEASWVLSGLLLLGAGIVGIGIISLIAANWNEIPDPVKLGGDFLLLTALAVATFRSWEAKKAIQFEALLLSFLILCLASIGLISQIYHTGGKLYQALLLWSLITFGAAIAARRTAVPFLWAGAFLTGLVFTALDSVALQPIFQRDYHAVFMAVPLLCAGLTVLSKGLAEESGPTRAFRSWTLIAGLLALVVAEFPELSRYKVGEGQTALVPGYVLGTVAAFGIWRSFGYRNIQKKLLLLTLGLFFIPFHLPRVGIEAPLTYAVLTIAVLSLVAIFLASLKERRLFQLFLSFLSLRFLVLYFQAFGGLATTGVGLIISGCLVIALAVLWNRYRTELAVWAERWVQ